MPITTWVKLSDLDDEQLLLELFDRYNISSETEFKLRVIKPLSLDSAVKALIRGIKYNEVDVYNCLDMYFIKLENRLDNATFKMRDKAVGQPTYSRCLLSGASSKFYLKSVLKSCLHEATEDRTFDLYRYHYESSRTFYAWLVDFIEIGFYNKDNNNYTEKVPMSKETSTKTAVIGNAVKNNVKLSKKAVKIAFDIEAGKLGVNFVKEQIKPFLPETVAMFADTTEADFVLAQLLAFCLQSTAGMHGQDELAESLAEKMITFAAVQEVGKFDLSGMIINMAKAMGLDTGKLVKKEEIYEETS